MHFNLQNLLRCRSFVKGDDEFLFATMSISSTLVYNPNEIVHVEAIKYVKLGPAQKIPKVFFDEAAFAKACIKSFRRAFHKIACYKFFVNSRKSILLFNRQNVQCAV